MAAADPPPAGQDDTALGSELFRMKLRWLEDDGGRRALRARGYSEGTFGEASACFALSASRLRRCSYRNSSPPFSPPCLQAFQEQSICSPVGYSGLGVSSMFLNTFSGTVKPRLPS